MRSFPSRASPAQTGLLSGLRSWLGFSSGERWPSPVAPPSQGKAQPVHDSGSARVLVVDDNPVNLMVVSAMLESRGLERFMAADGAEAVALAREIRFDLVLMDLQMPVLDGLGATAAIRRIERLCAQRPVPVVAYTSTLPGTHVLAACGLNGSLSKPCEDQDLEDCLARWCPSYRATSQGAPAVGAQP